LTNSKAIMEVNGIDNTALAERGTWL